MRNDSLTNWTISYRMHSVLQTFLRRFCSNVGKRWTEEKILCMLKKFFSSERFATFANDRVTSPTHAQRWKNDYGRLPTFPKKSENARRALAKTSWCDGSLTQKMTLQGIRSVAWQLTEALWQRGWKLIKLANKPSEQHGRTPYQSAPLTDCYTELARRITRLRWSG